jgi:glycerol-3-phosphate dehydrogenase
MTEPIAVVKLQFAPNPILNTWMGVRPLAKLE